MNYQTLRFETYGFKKLLVGDKRFLQILQMLSQKKLYIIFSASLVLLRLTDIGDFF